VKRLNNSASSPNLSGVPVPSRSKRFASGRARALGIPTRGTTNPNRLRRVDRWLLWALAPQLRRHPDPLVVDLGFGASPVTTLELFTRLRARYPGARVLGLEIDDDRVSIAQPHADPPGLTFAKGGFELAGNRPVVVRAMNVLRQYDDGAVAGAWQAMCTSGAVVIDGTCDEIGRRACWLRVEQNRPVSLTLSAELATLERPSELAERLPKALIARNVTGEPVHELLTDLDACWAAAASIGVFGSRQRWMAAADALRERGWPVIGRRDRWRLGELTVRWPPAST
jgi:hypothetical protein